MSTRSASGRHTAPRHRSRDAGGTPRRRVRLIVSPAVIGVLSVGLAGAAVFVVPDSLTANAPDLARSSVSSAASDTYLSRRNETSVSRSIDRKVLERQATEQAQQRTKALAAQAKETEQRADKLKKAKKAKEKRIEAREARQWVLPVAGYRLTARFGQSSSLWSTVHTGLDFAAANGTQLVAVARGTVTSTGVDGAYGNKTVITLEDGTEVWYAHQMSIDVSPGEQVDPGDPIGTVGGTGNVTGPHLHLEVRPGGGEPVDPYSVLQEHNVTP